MKQPIKQFTIAAAASMIVAAAAGLCTNAAAAEDTHLEAGFLTCTVDGAWGFIVGSTRKLHCVYEPTKGTQYNYYGEVNQFGADIGYHRASVMLWTVVDATHDRSSKSLVGTYGGATAQASVGVGAGASVLVGGFKNSVTLQPVAISVESGLNAAAGVQSLTLKEAKESVPVAAQRL
jgi:hypothetical protein